ncbi:transposase [Caldicellulosiruptor morganii]|uniref:Mutator family transposase n=1 Tax=Caldicellulosiruptor morganii TaxID=1387555 RepID=A0ABY7BRC8_9FIRM|nr:transposase [Caldicellulosiruptor morganii]WAM34927.1 transposase [Caldicellulosiruptor morganii]
MKERGLNRVDLGVSDHHKGLVQAIYRHFQGATWQRCQTHFVRAIFEAPDAKTAKVLLNQVLEESKDKAPEAMEVLEKGFEDAIGVLEPPEQYRRRLCTG